MVNCSYCHKELDREVFCNASHKVLFHRKGEKRFGGTIKKATTPEVIKVVEDLNVDDWAPPKNLSKEFFTSRGKGRK